jgi:hypothetical protein
VCHRRRKITPVVNFLHDRSWAAASGETIISDITCVTRWILILAWSAAKIEVNQPGTFNAAIYRYRVRMQHIEPTNISVNNASLVHGRNTAGNRLKVAGSRSKMRAIDKLVLDNKN